MAGKVQVCVRSLYCWFENQWVELVTVGFLVALVAVVGFLFVREKKAVRDGIIPGYGLRLVIFEGHKYIKHLDGGIVHAQSCGCLIISGPFYAK
jgi:uncharacterized membrane protein (DUF441 family)